MGSDQFKYAAMEIQVQPSDYVSNVWDWEDLLDFAANDDLAFHLDSDNVQLVPVKVTTEPPKEVLLEPSSSNPGKVRKLWSNFLASSVPFVCLEIEKKLMKIGGGGGDWAWEKMAKVCNIRSFLSENGTDTIFDLPLAKKLSAQWKLGTLVGYSGTHSNGFPTKLPWKETFTFDFHEKNDNSDLFVVEYFKSTLGEDFESCRPI